MKHYPHHHHHKPANPMKKFVFGALVILAGVLLLAFNTGYLPVEYKRIVFSWQMLLIAIGVINICDRNSWVSGVILIAIGSFFLAPRLFFFPFDLVKTFWPALLIFIGIMILFGHSVFHNWRKRIDKHRMNEFKSDGGFIEETNIFSGGRRVVNITDFRGGKITNIFGGSDIDFTQAQMAGNESYLDITCVFGGLTIYVPHDWDVSVETTSILGGFGDKSHGRIHPSGENVKRLIIKGVVIIGGGEIKR